MAAALQELLLSAWFFTAVIAVRVEDDHTSTAVSGGPHEPGHPPTLADTAITDASSDPDIDEAEDGTIQGISTDGAQCSTLKNRGTHLTTPVSVGTPPQWFNMVADSGSSYVIVPDCLCLQSKSCPPTEHCFTENDSTTFSMAGDKKKKRKQPGLDGGAPHLAEVAFGSGVIQAAIGEDYVSSAGVKGYCNNSLLLMLNSALRIEGPFEGILGLGIPRDPSKENETGLNDKEKEIPPISPSFVASMDIAAKEHESPSLLEFKPPTFNKKDQEPKFHIGKGFMEQAGVERFSMCVQDEGDGVLRINPPPTGTSLGSVGQMHWGLELQGVSVGEESPTKAIFCKPSEKTAGEAMACGVIPDTGTTVMTGPREHVLKLFQAACDAWPRCVKAHEERLEALKKAKAKFKQQPRGARGGGADMVGAIGPRASPIGDLLKAFKNAARGNQRGRAGQRGGHGAPNEDEAEEEVSIVSIRDPSSMDEGEEDLGIGDREGAEQGLLRALGLRHAANDHSPVLLGQPLSEAAVPPEMPDMEGSGEFGDDGQAFEDQFAGAAMAESMEKHTTFAKLLSNCHEWIDNGTGLDEMPSIFFHVAGSEGSKQTLEFKGSAYVIEMLQDEVALTRIGNFVVPKPTGKQEKVCAPAIGIMDIVTSSGPVWILGTPLFYNFNVMFNVVSKPPSLSINKQECGKCMSKKKKAGSNNASLMETEISSEISERGRRPRFIKGPLRFPQYDFSRGF
eukprot:TRINITY_DN3839_c0_g1_i6.p1 TRINITY_DN3839_c0_g1~~TRINITY_DN3839_c0_g1_i6.p1  ORF type:complete len:756 (+),score=161.72 TRINITY_DN3839_c0_g1_i6:69-2270(+)